MPITLKDDQISKLANYIADFFTKQFSQKQLSVKTFIEGFDNNTRIFKGQIKNKAYNLWQEKLKHPGNSLNREYDDLLTLVKSATKSTPEEKLKTLLPEEKIICNQNAFRSLLENVDFAKIDKEKENNILNRLKTEAIGLNDQQIYIYYNLLKLTKKPDKEDKEESEAVHLKQDLDSIINEILENISDFFVSPDKLKNINDNINIPEEVIQDALALKIKNKKVSLQVLRLLTGCFDDNEFFVNLCKNYLGMVCSKWGTSIDQALSFYTAYLIFNSLSQEDYKRMKISRPLQNFLIGEVTKLKPIIAVSIRFIYLLSLLLGSQVLEINKKYRFAPTSHQEKIYKLYSSVDRRKMLFMNAANFAFQKMEAKKSEYLETQKICKVFMQKKSTVLSQQLIFDYEY